MRKPKTRSREFMLKVDNIIPLWRVVIYTTISELQNLNLVMSIEFSNVDILKC